MESVRWLAGSLILFLFRFTQIFFAPADYGIIQLIYAYMAILNIVFIYGLDSAYLKFASFKDIGDEKDNFSTPYISVFATSLLISFLIIINSDIIGSSLRIPSEYTYLIYSRCCYFISGCQYSHSIPEAEA